jgi:hypothetical protein
VNKQMLACENLFVVEAFDTSTFRGGGRLLIGSSTLRAAAPHLAKTSSRPELLGRRRCQMLL